MIKVISFDIGGTLIKKPIDSSLCKMLFQYAQVNYELFKEEYRRCFICRNYDFYSFCEKVKIQNSEIVLRIIDEYYHKPSGIVYDDVYSTLEWLKSIGMKLITISNISYCNTKRLKDYGLEKYFIWEFYSCDLGYSKPDIQIFRYAESCLKVRPEEILHIGDSLKADFYGARRAGWNSYLLCRNETNNQRYSSMDGKSINSLVMLRGIQ